MTNESSIGDPNIFEIYKKNLEEFSSVSDDYTNIMNKDNLLYINNIFASQSHIIIGLASGLFITTYSKETLDKKFIMISSHTHIVYEKFNSTWITNGNLGFPYYRGLMVCINGKWFPYPNALKETFLKSGDIIKMGYYDQLNQITQIQDPTLSIDYLMSIVEFNIVP